MGLFDSCCGATGLSLNPFLQLTCIPLRMGDRGGFVPGGSAILGTPDFVGGIGDATPTPPFVLMAPPVWEALSANTHDVAAWLETRGHALLPKVDDGAQHDLGHIMQRHRAAERRFSDVPWMQVALAECAELAERNVGARLRSEAPKAGWLTRSRVSWYGVYAGHERDLATSFDELCVVLASLSGSAFDPDTLLLRWPLSLIVTQLGEPSPPRDLSPAVWVVLGDQRARLADREAAERIFGTYAEADPSFEVDRAALREIAIELDAPVAPRGAEILVPTPWGMEPEWAPAHEATYGLTRFGYVRMR